MVRFFAIWCGSLGWGVLIFLEDRRSRANDAPRRSWSTCPRVHGNGTRIDAAADLQDKAGRVREPRRWQAAGGTAGRGSDGNLHTATAGDTKMTRKEQREKSR